MAGTNDQQLPPGLGGVAPAQVPAVPGAPSGSSVVVMPNPTPSPAAYQQQFLQPAPTVPSGQEPPAPVQHLNPMLTTLAAPAPPAPPAAPAPAPPVLPAPPVVPEPPKADAPTGTVADLAGSLGSDPAIAPGIAYLEAAAATAQLDVARAFGQAADELDVRFIDKAYLVEKVGQAQADQMIKVAEASIVYAKAATEKLYSDVRASAGGDEAWGQAITLFNQHAPQETKVAIAALFDSMNKEQMTYAAAQVVAFAKGTGGVVTAGAQPLGVPGAVQGMTADQYREALHALPRNAPDSAFDNLRAQRAAGQKAGL